MIEAQARAPRAVGPAQRGAQARRRDERQRLTGGAVGGAHQVAAQVQVQHRAAGVAVPHALLAEQAHRAAGLQPGEARLHAGVGVLRQVVAPHLAGGQQADVVAVVAGEGGDGEAVRAVLPLRADVEAGGFLQPQRRVAQLPRGGGDVRAVGEQLVVPGRALRERQVAGELPARRDVDQRPQRRAAGREAPAAGGEALALVAAVGAHAHLLGARAEGQLAPARGQFLVREQRRAARAAGRQEGLLAQRGELVALELQAPHALQVAEGAVAGLHAQLAAAVLEGGAGLVAFVLGVAVVAVAELAAHAFDQPAGVAPQAFQRHAGGAHADGHVVLGHGAVVAAVAGHRGTKVAAVEEQRTAHRAAGGAVGRVADAPGGFGRARLVAAQRDRHGGVAGVAREGIDVQRVAVVAALDQRGAAGFAVAAGPGGISPAGDAALGARHRLARDAVVDHVDHAALRAAAIQQRGRAAQHLHALHGQRVDGGVVVVAERRGIDAGAAVLQDAHAVAVQPADGWPPGVGAEVGAGHARLVLQRVAQRGGALQQQVLAAQHARGRHRLLGAERIAGDGDFGQAGRRRGAIIGGRGLLRVGARAGQGAQQGHGAPGRAWRKGCCFHDVGIGSG